MRIVEDSELAKRNLSLLVGEISSAYNAVLSTTFADEQPYTTQLTLSEVKAYCSIDGNDLDSVLAILIPAARIVVEKGLNKSLVRRTVTAKVLNDLGGITLPYGPVIGDITSITDSEVGRAAGIGAAERCASHRIEGVFVGVGEGGFTR